MVKLATRERVIFALLRKDGQRNKELLAKDSADTNHNSLAKVLTDLQTDKIIVKDKENRYWFSTKLENNVLKALGSAYTIAKSLDRFSDDLANSNDPFKPGIEKIGEILRLQVMMRVERYAVPKLTKRDKLEFDIYFDIFDAVLEWIFDILRKKDAKKTDILRMQLIKTMSGKK